MSRASRSLAATVAGIAIVAGSAMWGTALADSPVRAPKLLDFRADVRVGADGHLTIKETQSFDFGEGGPAQLPRTFSTKVAYDSSHDQRYELSGFKATLEGKTIPFDVEAGDAETATALRFNSQPRGKATITLEYTVRGAVSETPDGLELSWPVVQGFNTAVDSATATVSSPAVSWAACFAGRLGSARPCTATQLGELTRPQFDQERLGAGERMTVVLGIPVNSGVSADRILDRRWSLQQAFALTPLSVGLLIVLLLLGGGGTFLLWWLRGRDTRASGEGTFLPSEQELSPEGIHPGQLGTVVDERADVIDVVATVLDLAVRGQLVIAYPDWRIERAEPPQNDVPQPYEQRLLDLLFAGGTTTCTLAELAERAPTGLPQVQDSLYADVLTKGWFYQRPDAVRTRWATAGAVLGLTGLVLTVVLAAVTDLGLVGLGVVLAGGLLVWGGDLAPARTAKGSALLGKLHAFREHLETAEPAEAGAGHAAHLLPYALVFGSEARWARALATSGEALPWLRTPDGWNRAELPDVVEGFATSLSGTISTARRLRV